MRPHFDPGWLAEVAGGDWFGEPVPVRGFCHDTRKLTEGDLFIALRTAHRDGHDFLESARAAGAAAAIVARPVPAVHLPQLVTGPDTLGGFQRIAAAHRQRFKGPVIGVTGSCGKTSTKELLAELLGATCHKTDGNLNNFLGVPLTLMKLGPLHDFAVVEAGISERGEMRELASMIDPDWAVVTTVGAAHLEQLETLDGVAREKSRLCSHRSTTRPVFPAQCLAFREFAGLGDATVIADEATAEAESRVRWRLVPAERGQYRLTVVFPQGHHVSALMPALSDGLARNAALCVAVAAGLGVDTRTIEHRLSGWTPPRVEIIEIPERRQWFFADCYNANPTSMLDAVSLFRRMADPSRPHLYVLGGMRELGPGSPRWHALTARKIGGRLRDRFLLVGEEARDYTSGLRRAGVPDEAVAVVETAEDGKPVVEQFEGAVFVKGSRAYALEELVPGHKTKGALLC